MRLLYIAVHENNKDWGAQHIFSKEVPLFKVVGFK